MLDSVEGLLIDCIIKLILSAWNSVIGFYVSVIHKGYMLKIK
jgi:hypothetical protein